MPVDPAAYALLHDGMIALSRMEHNGIKVDEEFLDNSIAKADKEAAEILSRLRTDPLYSTWRRLYGDKSKISAPDQLTGVLFDSLKIPYPLDPDGKGPDELPDAYTPSGRYISSDEVLNQIDLPFVNDWRRHKKLVKLSSTFLKGLKREVVAGKLHPFFNLHTVISYRSSSGSDKSDERSTRDFNFQNLPVRIPEFSKAIRECFVPRKGRRLIENDFGSLEFCGCAVWWDDPSMIAYASDPTKDIHRDMAAKLFDCPVEEVESKTMRYIAKNQFVFPELYGSFHGQIAPRIWEALDKLQSKTKSGIPVKKWLKQQGIRNLEGYTKHVEKCEQWFMNKFHVFANKKEDWYQTYRKKGEFRMLTGFVCRGLYSKNFLLNAPVQGMGFHWCLKTIIRMQDLIDRRSMKALLVGQIHDCIIGDVPEDEVQAYLNMIKKVVSDYLPKVWKWISVPLKIEAEVTDLAGTEKGRWYYKTQWVADNNGIWAPVSKG